MLACSSRHSSHRLSRSRIGHRVCSAKVDKQLSKLLHQAQLLLPLWKEMSGPTSRIVLVSWVRSMVPSEATPHHRRML